MKYSDVMTLRRHDTMQYLHYHAFLPSYFFSYSHFREYQFGERLPLPKTIYTAIPK